MKRKREGTLRDVPSLNQVFWRIDASNEEQGALDTIAAMGAFAGANYDSMSQLTKYLLSKEQELKTSKRDLEAVEAR